MVSVLGESHFSSCQPPKSSNEAFNQSKKSGDTSARVAVRAGGPLALAATLPKAKGKKASNAALRCLCGHAKSIHARMYANPLLGTSCNFPDCRCKAYKAAASRK
jgi:hypothetical protein